MKGWKRGIVAALVLIALIAVLVPELVFLDQVFISPDTKAPMSFGTVGRKSLDEGTYPLWNPYLFLGVPFLANAQTAVLYPLNLALCWLPAPKLVAWCSPRGLSIGEVTAKVRLSGS